MLSWQLILLLRGIEKGELLDGTSVKVLKLVQIYYQEHLLFGVGLLSQHVGIVLAYSTELYINYFNSIFDNLQETVLNNQILLATLLTFFKVTASRLR